MGLANTSWRFRILCGELVWVIIFWGLHMALTQGLISHMVADVAPSSPESDGLRLFNLTTAIALILASTAAGILWDKVGPAGPFVRARRLRFHARCHGVFYW